MVERFADAEEERWWANKQELERPHGEDLGMCLECLKGT